MKFGEALREERKQQKMSLRELAAEIGKSFGWLCDIEKGRRGVPELPDVEKIEAALGIDDQSLMILAIKERKHPDVAFVEAQFTSRVMRVQLRLEQAQYDLTNTGVGRLYVSRVSRVNTLNEVLEILRDKNETKSKR